SASDARSDDPERTPRVDEDVDARGRRAGLLLRRQLRKRYDPAQHEHEMRDASTQHEKVEDLVKAEDARERIRSARRVDHRPRGKEKAGGEEPKKRWRRKDPEQWPDGDHGDPAHGHVE